MASSSLPDAAPARRASSRQRRAAFHEAGRALAFLYAGHPFTAASVWPVAEGYAGRMEGASAVHGGCIGAARLSAELEIVAVLAGPLAETRAARRSLGAIVLTDGNHDWHRAHDLAATWFPAAPSAVLALAEERARAGLIGPGMADVQDLGRAADRNRAGRMGGSGRRLCRVLRG
jgi:hypothetical protein